MAEQMEIPGKIDYRPLVLLSLGHMVTDINSSALPAMLPFLKESLGSLTPWRERSSSSRV